MNGYHSSTNVVFALIIQMLFVTLVHASPALDRYDTRLDLECFIRKLRVSYAVLLKNESTKKCTLTIELINKGGEIISDERELQPQEQFIIEPASDQRLYTVKLTSDGCFLNPKWHAQGRIYLLIEESEDRFFLHTYFPFNFEAKPFSKTEFEKNHSADYDSWMKQFNNNLHFVNTTLGKNWGLNLKKIEAHRRALYKKNNVTQILKNDPLAIDRAENQIPLITHTIWVTSNQKPHPMPEHNLNYLMNSITPNPSQHGWKHYVWIESREKLPVFANKIDQLPDLIVMEIEEFDKDFISGELYKKAIKAGEFGKATDILRLEILMIYGGFYRDTDYEIFQSLKPYAKVYDFICAIEPMSAFLCNAFIGSRPNHPVLHTYLDMIIQNLTRKKNDAPAGYKTIIETGPAMLTLAFALAAGQGNNRDIALPHMLIFPSKYNTYPCKPVVTPGWTIPAESIGAHYWETSWMNPKLGSKG